LLVRRFRCLNPDCPKETFAETWPEFLAVRAQRTLRLTEVQGAVGLALGGEAGYRLLRQLREPVSADTLLRLVRHQSLPEPVTPHVLGVDDFCFRRGKTYGTILIDLERHQVVDLLPDRKAETLAAWLKGHPGVQIISRDRYGDYARGAALGAPNAQQIADRFHLLLNLRDAAEAWLKHHRALLVASPPEVTTQPLLQAEPAAQPFRKEIRPTTTVERISQTLARRAHRQALYERAAALRAQGYSFKAIAGLSGVSRSAITAWLKPGGFERKTPPSAIMPYANYLEQRVKEPEWTTMQLYEEIVVQGYTGAVSGVSTHLAWLQQGQAPPSVSDGIQGEKPEAVRRFTPRQGAWWVTKAPTLLTDSERRRLSLLLDRIPLGHEVYALIQEFAVLLRTRPTDAPERLKTWVEQAQSSAIRALQQLGKGIQKDFSAVQGAVQSPWSNGQTEGQVNRLKMLKRQMFGRANFDLLRLRVLLA